MKLKLTEGRGANEQVVSLYVMRGDRKLGCEMAMVAHPHTGKPIGGMSRKIMEARARRIIMCVNRHDELMAALDRLARVGIDGADLESGRKLLTRIRKEG